MDTGFAPNATDRNLRAWLSAGPVDRSVGDGLTFVASAASARQGKGSWILRFRFGGRQREKVLGRYPDLPLKEARALARQDRALLQQGTDVAAAKQLDKLKASDIHTVDNLSEAWFARHILGSYKHPEVVERVLRRHIQPVIGKLPVEEVRPVHVDRVLTKIVDSGAPTVANDALRYLVRMFHFAVKRRLIDTNPAFGFDNSDAGGPESSRVRWLKKDELLALGRDMKSTPNFGRPNELAVWLLLALCVRKMELLSARWLDFDLEVGVWHLNSSSTKTRASIDIPLAAPVIEWLKELQVFACGEAHLFPARRRLAVINFSGNVGNTTVARHLLAPRIPDCQVVAVERINADDGQSVTIRGREFAQLQEFLQSVDNVVIDIGASNVEDLLKLMRRYRDSQEDFDGFIVPTVPASKQQQDTAATLAELARIGVPPERLRLVFNQVDEDSPIDRTFDTLLAYCASSGIIPPLAAFISFNEVYALVRGTGHSLVELAADRTDYKAEIAKASTKSDKLMLAHRLATQRLARGVIPELDACFAVLDLHQLVQPSSDEAMLAA